MRLRVTLLLALALAGCHGTDTKAEAAAAAPAPLRTAQVVKVLFRPSIEVSGSLDPVATVQLGFDVPGRIDKLYVVRGGIVAAGDPIAKLDDTLAQAQLAQATAGLSAAESQSAAADTSWARVQKLGDAISGQDRTSAEAGHQGAQAQVEQARAGVKMAKTNVGFQTLRAPIGGMITASPDNAGPMVGAGTPMFVIEDLSALRLKASVPETAGWVSDQATVVVRSGVAGADSPVPAVIERVIPSLDPATRRIPVEIRVDQPPATLRAHGFVRAIVTSAVDVDAFEIPKGALVARPEFGVIVKEGDAPRFVPVEVLDDRGASVVVSGVLTEGQPVVIDPPHGYGE